MMHKSTLRGNVPTAALGRDPDFVRRVGRIIRRLRTNLRLSRRAVADAAGISASMLAQLELKGQKGIKLDNARRICDVLGLPLEYVLAEATSNAELRRAIIDTFRSSPWSEMENVSPSEIAWLESIPLERCLGDRPEPRAVMRIIEAHRMSSAP